MPLANGTRIGPYEIVAAIGAGGMGEVYRAHDTRLGREVAIKVLPAAVAADADRLGRFEREARILASLNHPHIAQIYGLEGRESREGQSGPVIVMELVDGETLADKLRHGSWLRADGQGPTTHGPSAINDQRSAIGHQPGRGLPVAEALDIARQIADALDAAHERGIVHRDLKPANIKITPDGVVKVLDFGLAKGGEAGWPGRVGLSGSGGAGGFDQRSQSPTMLPATVQGVLLGTAPYMSPEQARGKSVDKRTDIWAFGCVMFEMFAGRPAFAGETASDTIALILEREPDWSALPPSVTPVIRRLVQRCLQKDPRRRLRDMGDLRFELDAPPVAIDPASGPVRASRSRTLAAFAAGALVAAIAVWGWQQWLARRPIASHEVRLHRLTDFVGLEEAPAIAPDGKTVAFVASVDGKRQILIRLLAGGTPLQLTRNDTDHEQPRWMPDSSALIYYTPPATPGEQGAIWEISALGGVPRRVTTAVSGGDVSHDGARIAVFQVNDGRMELTAVARDGSRSERIRQLSPDDRSIAFSRYDPTSFDERIYVAAASGGEPREVAGGVDLRGFCWLPDGSGLVYSSAAGSTVVYPPTFNLRLSPLNGSGERQLTFGDVSYVEPDIGSSGDVVASRIRMQSDVWKFPMGGSPVENTRAAVRVTQQTGQVQTPSVSPDGTELVYLADSGGHGNLWVAKTDGSGGRQLTFERDPRTTLGVPVWSPTRNLIVFISARERTGAVQWLVAPDGSGLREFVRGAVWTNWSGDGQWLYYVQRRERGYCIEKSPVDGGSAVSVRCDNAVAPAVSADGSTLYYFTPLKRAFGGWDWEIRAARPESGPSQPLAQVAASQVPTDPINAQGVLSPDGMWLALPLTNGTTSNVWLVATSGGPLRQATDFGARPTLIARRVSWSPEGKHLYAAVADIDADVVLLDGLLR